LWRLRRYGEAVEAFDQAIAQKPEFFIDLAYYGKGLALGSGGQLKEAAAAWELAVKAKPDFVPAWNYLSVAYRELQQLDRALTAINQAINLEDGNPNLYNQKRGVLSDLKRYAEAELAISQAIKLSPRAAFYTNRGIVYADQQKWDLAVADYTQAIAINPNLAEAYNNRGIVYRNQQKWDLAVADYTQAIAINPNLAEAYTNRGNVYRNQQKWDLAVADFTQAIAINPNLAEAYYNRGNVYADLQKWDLALADYTQAIAINPNYAEAYGNRGIVYLNLGDINKARENFQRAAQLFLTQGRTADYERAITLLNSL
jgi:tetratricopeptide (TPR) repeat protein